MKKALFFTLLALSCVGCSGNKSNNDDDDDVALITQPVTNNPQLIPDHEASLPGVPSYPQGSF